MMSTQLSNKIMKKNKKNNKITNNKNHVEYVIYRNYLKVKELN